MNVIQKENLESLSKEQLIKIIEDWHKQLHSMSRVCVGESKCHIDSIETVEKIREYLCEADKYKFYDSNLRMFVDFQLGKISKDEYRDILWSVVENER